MTRPRNEAESRERFAEMYAKPQTATAHAISQAVLGHGFGVNGYTTADQATALSATLETGPDARVLEIGSANGWPGSHVGRTLGASVVATDIPTAGFRRDRASEAPGKGELRLHVCAADARHLPFPHRCFDAVIHADVLC